MTASAPLLAKDRGQDENTKQRPVEACLWQNEDNAAREGHVPPGDSTVSYSHRHKGKCMGSSGEQK